MSPEKVGLLDDPVQLAEALRLEYGAQLPAAEPRESHRDRELRREKTKYALEQEVMPRVNRARVSAGRPVLSVEQEDHVVELVLSAMFLLPHLFGILEREPLAEDLMVFGADPVRVDLATGEIKEYPPLVPFDAALERVISNVAMDHHRPFSFEAPFVDVQLAPHLRFHGQGFDVVSRPAIFIRVHRVLGRDDRRAGRRRLDVGRSRLLPEDGRAGGSAARWRSPACRAPGRRRCCERGCSPIRRRRGW